MTEAVAGTESVEEGARDVLIDALVQGGAVELTEALEHCVRVSVAHALSDAEAV